MGEIKKNAMWLVAWQEYGIFEQQTESSFERFSIIKTREFLKDQMKKITAFYPQLTVIAGTIATIRID